jgi:hypothetical protein
VLARSGTIYERGSQQACCCTGGHFTEPNEQNTQQSPGFGRNVTLQAEHS